MCRPQAQHFLLVFFSDQSHEVRDINVNLNVPKYFIKPGKVASSESFNFGIYQHCDDKKKIMRCSKLKVQPSKSERKNGQLVNNCGPAITRLLTFLYIC